MNDTPPKVGLGIDAISVSRVQRLLSEHPTAFRDFAFSSSEQRYCDNKPFPAQHFAARWATKESFIKAIGSSEANPDLSTIEIVGSPVPQLSLHGEGEELLREAAIDRDTTPEHVSISVSLTHELNADLAIGMVIILF